MTRKTTITDHIISEFKTVGGFTNTFRHFKFLEQINDYPSICIYTSPDDWNHSESTITGKDFILSVRGYVKSEDSIGASDQLITDIEDTVAQITLPGYIDSIRVESVDTDEGLFSPYGIVDMKISVMY